MDCGAACTMALHGLNDVNAVGQTALHCAVKSGNRHLIECLICRGCRTGVRDNDGKTAVHYASQAGRCDVMRLLLGFQFSMYSVDKYGRNALHLAVLNERIFALIS